MKAFKTSLFCILATTLGLSLALSSQARAEGSGGGNKELSPGSYSSCYSNRIQTVLKKPNSPLGWLYLGNISKVVKSGGSLANLEGVGQACSTLSSKTCKKVKTTAKCIEDFKAQLKNERDACFKKVSAKEEDTSCKIEIARLEKYKEEISSNSALSCFNKVEKCGANANSEASDISNISEGSADSTTEEVTAADAEPANTPSTPPVSINSILASSASKAKPKNLSEAHIAASETSTTAADQVSSLKLHLNIGSHAGKTRRNLLGTNILYWIQDKKVLEARGNRSLFNTLKKAGVAQLRFPGGTVANNYNWETNRLDVASRFPEDSGPKDAKIRSNYVDFLKFNDRLDADANFVVNIFSNNGESIKSKIKHAQKWLCAVNSPLDDKVKRKCKKQGLLPDSGAYTAAKKVKFWEIGNEVYHCNTYYQLSADTYAERLKLFSKAMKRIDSSIKIGAVGPFNDEACADKGTDWWRVLAQKAASDFDFIVLHRYDPTRRVSGFKVPVKFSSSISAVRNKVFKYSNEPKPKRKQVAVTEYNQTTTNTATPHEVLLIQIEQLVHLYKSNVQFANFWPLFIASGKLKESALLEKANNSGFKAKAILDVYSQISEKLGTKLLKSSLGGTNSVDHFASRSKDGKTALVVVVNRNDTPRMVETPNSNGKIIFRREYFSSGPEKETAIKTYRIKPRSKDFRIKAKSINIVQYEIN